MHQQTLNVIVVKRRASASSSQMEASPDSEMIEEHVPIILNDDGNVNDDYGYSNQPIRVREMTKLTREIIFWISMMISEIQIFHFCVV